MAGAPVASFVLLRLVELLTSGAAGLLLSPARPLSAAGSIALLSAAHRARLAVGATGPSERSLALRGLL